MTGGVDAATPGRLPGQVLAPAPSAELAYDRESGEFTAYNDDLRALGTRVSLTFVLGDDLVVERILRSAAVAARVTSVEVAGVLALPSEHGVHPGGGTVADRPANDHVNDDSTHDRLALTHASESTP